MAGVVGTTPMCDVLDLLTVIMLELTGEHEQRLRKWHAGLERATLVADAKAGKLDRSAWGLQPHQIEQQRAAMRTLGQSGALP